LKSFDQTAFRAGIFVRRHEATEHTRNGAKGKGLLATLRSGNEPMYGLRDPLPLAKGLPSSPVGLKPLSFPLHRLPCAPS
jgi:hypothetical protein